MHTLKVRKIYFDMIKRGVKTVECRLNDDRRRDIKIGDIIEICENDNLDDKFLVRVIGLHYAESFCALCDVVDCHKMGFNSADELVGAISQFYSPIQQSQWGAVGIEIELI